MDNIISEYRDNLSLYSGFASKLEKLLGELMGEASVKIHDITSRVKTQESLEGKIKKPTSKYKYEQVEDVTDIVGVRIITYFEDDISKIQNILEKEFNVDANNSVDKGTQLKPKEFGYRSVHKIVSLSESRTCLSEYRNYKGLKAEIQIRSILQHAWAEMEHDLGYKGSTSVPPHIERKFTRLAGVLELADQEFTRIHEETEAYRHSLEDVINNEPRSVGLDEISIASFMGSDNLIESIDTEIALAVNASIDQESNFSLKALRYLGIADIEMLREALISRKDIIVSFAKEWFGEGSHFDVPIGISLFYLCYVLALERFDEDGMCSFLYESDFDGETVPGLARDLITKAISLKMNVKASSL